MTTDRDFDSTAYGRGYEDGKRDAADEIARLRAGGCARDQGLTQYCAEAAERDAEIARLKAEVERLKAQIKLSERVDKAFDETQARLTARVKELEGDLSIMRLQRDAKRFTDGVEAPAADRDTTIAKEECARVCDEMHKIGYDNCGEAAAAIRAME